MKLFKLDKELMHGYRKLSDDKRRYSLVLNLIYNGEDFDKIRNILSENPSMVSETMAVNYIHKAFYRYMQEFLHKEIKAKSDGWEETPILILPMAMKLKKSLMKQFKFKKLKDIVELWKNHKDFKFYLMNVKGFGRHTFLDLKTFMESIE